MIKTMIVIQAGGLPDWKKYKKPADLFSAGEIDRLDERMFAGKSREELVLLRQKLSDSFDWLDTGDCDPGSPEWKDWERRLDRLSDLMDNIDGILNPEEQFDDEDDEW